VELPRIFVALLVIIWVGCFVCFAGASQLAFVSGSTFEYRLYGVQFPYVAFALLVCMATSSGLLWANYRGQDFRDAEELIYGCFFGLSVFGWMLDAVLVLMAGA
jgi:tryptophan-rich sensory protein